MVLVEAVAEDGETFAALLQNAETVRLVRDEGGNATAVSSLEIGDAVLVHRTEGARHTGLKIEEERWYET
jgi:3-dehydroquinate synthase class II